MLKKILRAVFIVLALLLLVVPLAKAKMQYNTKFDHWVSLYNPCTDEWIDAHYEEHAFVTITETPSGRVAMHGHHNVKFKGIGEDSGTEYVGKDVNAHWKDHYDMSGEPPWNFTISSSTQIKGSDGSKATLRWLVHYTVNANGEMTAEFDKEEIKCNESKAPAKKKPRVTTFGRIKSGD